MSLSVDLSRSDSAAVSTGTDTMHCILPEKLYLGTKEAASDLELLARHGITHILNVTPQVPFADERRFKCLRISVYDGDASLLEHLDEAHRFVEESERILVHCEMGVSRSASVVISYLIRSRGLTYGEAYAQVKKIRPVIKPVFIYEALLDTEPRRKKQKRDVA